MHRKQLGFSQKELAYLLGSSSPNIVSRYEVGDREPNLNSLFCYELIFSIQSCELFRDFYEQTKESLNERIPELLKRIEREQSVFKDEKILFLHSLASRLNSPQLQ